MKSRLIQMQQRTVFERWMRCAAACVLAFAFTACASQPAAQNPGPGPKVQTFHELMVKLKKGFDEGTLDTPEFYARELGYPLERAETLKVIPPPYTPSREIRFDSGELAGTVAQVGPVLDRDGRKAVSFGGSNVIRRNPGQPCIALREVQAVWGVVQPQPEVWGAHGPLPVLHYLYRSDGAGGARLARFVVDKKSGCVYSGPSVAQYYE